MVKNNIDEKTKVYTFSYIGPDYRNPGYTKKYTIPVKSRTQSEALAMAKMATNGKSYKLIKSTKSW